MMMCKAEQNQLATTHILMVREIFFAREQEGTAGSGECLSHRPAQLRQGGTSGRAAGPAKLLLLFCVWQVQAPLISLTTR